MPLEIIHSNITVNFKLTYIHAKTEMEIMSWLLISFLYHLFLQYLKILSVISQSEVIFLLDFKQKLRHSQMVTDDLIYKES